MKKVWNIVEELAAKMEKNPSVGYDLEVRSHATLIEADTGYEQDQREGYISYGWGFVDTGHYDELEEAAGHAINGRLEIELAPLINEDVEYTTEERISDVEILVIAWLPGHERAWAN